jgi:hypothetical protein
MYKFAGDVYTSRRGLASAVMQAWLGIESWTPEKQIEDYLWQANDADILRRLTASPTWRDYATRDELAEALKGLRLQFGRGPCQ